jgi:cytochrome c553
MSNFAGLSRNFKIGTSWRNRRICSRAIVFALMVGGVVAAGDVIAAEPVGPQLTDKLRGLLVKEMVEIEAAMHETYSAIIQGKHDEVAQKGQAIHESFILEQSLTEQDRQDLKAAAPAEFLQMDERFHRLSASLAAAGRQQNTQEQVEVFNRMTESCVACHSRYVTHRFERLQDQPLPETWGHEANDAGKE